MTTERQLNKKTICKEIVGESPEIVYVLTRGLVRRSNRGWITPAYSDVDNKGFMGGGRVNVVAAAELYRHFPKITFIVCSFVKKKGQPRKPHAEIYAKELIDRGVPGTNILLQTESDSTETELVELVKLTAEKGWKSVIVLGNETHIPRAEVMFGKLRILIATDKDPELHEALNKIEEEEVSVRFVKSEEILSSTSPHFKAFLKRARKSELYQTRLSMEQRGIEDLKRGNYETRDTTGSLKV